jgi:holo-[acyl-carrier protein] synthase
MKDKKVKVGSNVNNIFVGVDIESILRFKDLDRNRSERFLSKIFTKNEIDYCFSKRYPAQHLAARFAGKEALIKAIKSTKIKTVNLQLNNVEITNNVNGSPSVSINNYKLINKNNILNMKFKISLSHSEDMAIAFALLILQ